MYLIYVDESGNTGTRLDDPQQPVNVLVGVFVPEEVWQNAHQSWTDTVRHLCRELTRESGIPPPPELHAKDLYQGTGSFKGMERPAREEVLSAALAILREHRIHVVYSLCLKGALRECLADQDWDPARFSPLFPLQLLGASFMTEAIIEGDPGKIAWAALLVLCEGLLTHSDARGVLVADASGRAIGQYARQSVRDSVLIGLAEGDELPSFENGTILEDSAFLCLLDTVHFVDSRESPFIQLADIVAYFIQRAWRAGNWQRPGPEPHYDEYIRPVVRGTVVLPTKRNDG